MAGFRDKIQVPGWHTGGNTWRRRISHLENDEGLFKVDIQDRCPPGNKPAIMDKTEGRSTRMNDVTAKKVRSLLAVRYTNYLLLNRIHPCKSTWKPNVFQISGDQDWPVAPSTMKLSILSKKKWWWSCLKAHTNGCQKVPLDWWRDLGRWRQYPRPKLRKEARIGDQTVLNWEIDKPSGNIM